jgi:DNA-3-methyladenine glycosylase I
MLKKTAVHASPARSLNLTWSILLEAPQVIKNRKKVEAIIFNAQVFQRLKQGHGSFAGFLRSLKPLSDEDAIRVLRNQFKHVGTYTAEYYLHSVGYRK